MQLHTTILATAAMLILAATAAAQVGDEPVDTWLDVTQPDPVENWDGNTTIMRTIEVRLCWEEGATNPGMQSFRVNITVSGQPDWVNVSHPESISLTPPVGPTEEQGCSEPTTFDLQIHGRDDNQTGDGMDNTTGQPTTAAFHDGEDFTLQVTLTPQADQDPITGEQRVGNYDVPEEESFDIEVSSDDEPEQVPGPALVAMLALIGALVALARRRR